MRFHPLLLTIVLIIQMSFNISGQDTIYGRVDTLICSGYVQNFYFTSTYDTSKYESNWYLFGESMAFSSLDSIRLNDIDSLLLITHSINNMDTIYFDSVYFNLRFTPEINLDIPDIVCYNEDSVVIKDLTRRFGDYTIANYRLDNGKVIFPIDSLLNVYVGNGDSAIVWVDYEVPECPTVSDTVKLKTIFKPVSKFESDLVCFGDSTTILNNSSFDSTLAMFSLQIDGLDTFYVVEDTYKVFLPVNNDQRNVFVEITLGVCTEYDTFQIANKLQPKAKYNSLKVCENNKLLIENILSSNLTSNSRHRFEVNNLVFQFNNAEHFQLTDTIPHDTYQILGIADNGNGCIDSISWETKVDSVTYVSFENLDKEYCVNQDSSLLIGNLFNVVGNMGVGEFMGNGISDLSNNTAWFVPKDAGKNILVEFMYTNSLECSDTSYQVVDFVHPKPQLKLDGLLDAYCEFDPFTELILRDTSKESTIASNVFFQIVKDNVLIDSLTAQLYDFDPILAGSYVVANTYRDENGCVDSITNNTIVNPLPKVALDSSIIVIDPDEIATIRNKHGDEPDVYYIWSNGVELSEIEVDQPGIYTIYAMNINTECEARDTVKVEYKSSIETDLHKVSIWPNPTMGTVNITLDSVVNDITIIDMYGNSVTLFGNSSFDTDLDGTLSLDFSGREAGYYYILIPQVGNFLIVKIV